MTKARSFENIYVQWNNLFVTLFSLSQFWQIPFNFMHLSATKRFQLLHRAYQEILNANKLGNLTDITEACVACQKYAAGLIVFFVRFSDDSVCKR